MVNFLVQGFLGVLLEALRIFWVLIFASFEHPRHLSNLVGFLYSFTLNKDKSLKEIRPSHMKI